MRTELRELQNLFETSQKERAELELELLHCREELEKLTEERQVGRSLPKLKVWFLQESNYVVAVCFICTSRGGGWLRLWV